MTVAARLLATISRWAQPVSYTPPPTLPPPGTAWAPTQTVDWTAITSFAANNQREMLVMAETGGMKDLPTSTQEGVATGQPVGYWPNHLTLGAPFGGGYNDPASGFQRPRPVLQVVAALPSLQFNGTVAAPNGQRMRLIDYNWASAHIFITAQLWGTQALGQEHTLFSWNQKLRLYAARTNGLPSIRTNAGVYHDAPASSWSMANAWRLIELRFTESGVQWRVNNAEWTALGAFAFNVNELSQVGAHYYMVDATEGQPGKVAVYRMIAVQGAVTDEQAEPFRRYVTDGLSLPGLHPTGIVTPPEPPTPPPGGDTDYNDVTGVLRTVNVTNAATLQTALNNADPGDLIVCANGTGYASTVTCSRSGTTGNPIRIRAANIGQAENFRVFNLAGNHVRIEGLRWTGFTGGDSIVEVTGQHCRVHRCYMINCAVSTGAQRGAVRFQPGAHDGRATYNLFQNFSQRAICVRSINGGALRTIVRRNYFNGNVVVSGFSGVTVGYGGDSELGADNRRELFGLVEYNLVEDVGGGMGNILQAKCSRVTFQFNTARNCPNAFMQIRTGQFCDFIANAMLNSGGPLLQGVGHRLIGNYNDGGASGSWRDMGPQGGERSLKTIGDAESFGGATWAEDCLCAGNIGILRLGGGSSSWGNGPRNTIVEPAGAPFVVGPNSPVGTITRALTVTVPAYVVLQPANVGPTAP